MREYRQSWRIAALLGALALLIWGGFIHRYQVHALPDESHNEISGRQHVQRIAVDGLIRLGDRLYDFYSAIPPLVIHLDEGEQATDIPLDAVEEECAT